MVEGTFTWVGSVLVGRWAVTSRDLRVLISRTMASNLRMSYSGIDVFGFIFNIFALIYVLNISHELYKNLQDFCLI